MVDLALCHWPLSLGRFTPRGSKRWEQPLNQDDIAILEEHLPYELDMLVEALASWGSLPARADESRSDWFRRMSAIEVFWVHARNLEEFFEDRQAEGRTAAASHFLSGAELKYNMSEVTKLVKKVQDQIVHLNYDRPRESLEKLSYYEAERVKGHIDRAVNQFQIQLSHDARKHWKHREPVSIPVPNASPQPSSQFGAFGPSILTTSFQGSSTGPTSSPTKEDSPSGCNRSHDTHPQRSC